MNRKVSGPLCCLLAAALLLSYCSASRPAGRKQQENALQTEAALPDILRAVTVSAADYPGEAKEAEALQAAAQEICSQAARYSMNALFYEVTVDGEALWRSEVLPESRDYLSGGEDPLAALTEAAAEQQIAV